jgi:hypothetical protein
MPCQTSVMLIIRHANNMAIGRMVLKKVKMLKMHPQKILKNTDHGEHRQGP